MKNQIDTEQAEQPEKMQKDGETAAGETKYRKIPEKNRKSTAGHTEDVGYRTAAQ